MSSRQRDLRITPDTVQKRLQHIAKQIGTRLAGTEAEQQAAQYMAGQMEKYGLNVEIETFPCRVWDCEQAQLQVSINGKWRESACHPIAYTPSTPEDGIEAPMVYLGTGSEMDLAGKDLKGKIGFVFGLGGDEPSALRRLCSSGLVALVFVDDRLPMPWVVHAGTAAGWIDLLTIPAATVAYTEAWEIARMREPMARLFLRTTTREAQSQNVVASFGAQNNSLEPLVVTCHHDSVSLGEGAEDDGSGMAVMLAVAEALGQGTPPRPVKMISCGWEEALSEGARHYVASNIERAAATALVINIDSVGSWIGRDIVHVVGHGSLNEWTLKRLRETGYAADVRSEVSPYSDMFPFNLVRVPSLWFYRSNLGATRYYHHSAEDTLDKISFDALAHTAGAVANMVWHMGGATQLPFESGIPQEQWERIEHYRGRLLDSICDWRIRGLMRPGAHYTPEQAGPTEAERHESQADEPLEAKHPEAVEQGEPEHEQHDHPG